MGSCSGRFFAFEPESGEVLWQYDTAQDGASAQFHGDALLTDELVIVGTDARPVGHLYAFERDDGAVCWKVPFPGGVTVDVRRHGETVLAASVGGEVVAIDLRTGEPVWRVEAQAEGRDEGGVPARLGNAVDPALSGGRYYVPWRSGRLDAYDAATGELIWQRELPAVPNTSITPVGGGLVVGTLDGRLFRLDPGSGELTGELTVGSIVYGELVPAGDCLLALVARGADPGESGHELACVEPDLGGVFWRHGTGSDGEFGTFEPLLVRDQVVVGVEGKLLGVSRDDGSLRWSRPVRGLPRGLGSSPSMLYVGTLGGRVLALRWAPEESGS